MNIKQCLKIEYDKIFHNNNSLIHMIKVVVTNDSQWKRWKYIKYMRLADNNKYGFFSMIKYFYYLRRKNKLGNLLGYEINGKNIGEGLLIYHNGPVVINDDTIIGKNCSLHGDNCIGNNGISNECPIIGDNVEIGVGAKIIGKVKIGNNVKIGANAVVVNDILEGNCTVVGIPAHIIKK